MLPGETLDGALQRIKEQVDDGQRLFPSYAKYVVLDMVFRDSATSAGEYALGRRYVETRPSKGHPEYDRVIYKVSLIYRPRFLEGNVYAYRDGNHELYMKLISDFQKKLTEKLRVFYPGMKLSLNTDYGGSKCLDGSGNFFFNFNVTVETPPEM